MGLYSVINRLRMFGEDHWGFNYLKKEELTQ